MDKEKKSSAEDDTDTKNLKHEKTPSAGRIKKKLRRYVEEGIVLTESESDTSDDSAPPKKSDLRSSDKHVKRHHKKRRYLDDDLESGVSTNHHRDNCKIFLAVFSILVTLLCFVLIADLHYQRRSDVHTDIERATRLIQHIERDHMGVTAEQLYQRQARRQMDELEKKEDAAEASRTTQPIKPKEVPTNTTTKH